MVKGAQDVELSQSESKTGRGAQPQVSLARVVQRKDGLRNFKHDRAQQDGIASHSLEGPSTSAPIAGIKASCACGVRNSTAPV